MKHFRITYKVKKKDHVFECKAWDEKDAIFQFNAQHPEYKVDFIEEYLPPVKPLFVRVHHGFITINLIPEVAEKLGYKEGDRLATFQDFSHVVGFQNEFIVEEWFNRTGNERPENKMEAYDFMISNFSN